MLERFYLSHEGKRFKNLQTAKSWIEAQRRFSVRELQKTKKEYGRAKSLQTENLTEAWPSLMLRPYYPYPSQRTLDNPLRETPKTLQERPLRPSRRDP